MTTAIALLISVMSSAQIKNTKIEAVKINGNCGMCEKNIETAGSIKNTSSVDWNKDTKVATITYDDKKINSDEVLKTIALAGYDSEKFLAPDDAYNKLPKCCQYERVNKTMAKADVPQKEDHSMHGQNMDHTAAQSKKATGQLAPVFDGYFKLKDALVKSDGALASAEAKSFHSTIASVKMDALSSNEHTVWMNEVKELTLHAAHISKTKDIAHQRDHFAKLSQSMYTLTKASNANTSLYYQHCPMFKDGKGAHWLSKENTVKNPYYGSQMLSCGKTVETIQ